jgi:hypothetical protein
MNIINNFNIDLSPLSASKNRRVFSITGDSGAIFNLEVKNEGGYYYNFVTNVFQVAKSGLYNEVISSGAFNGNIVFPAVEDDDQYDISLSADPISTKHARYFESRFGDGSLDINSSRGSNSLLMTKVIYQYLDKTLTISPYSVGGTIEVGSGVSDTIVLPRGSSVAKQPFSIACSVSTAAKCYQIIKQPVSDDVISFVQPVVGAAPIEITGENIYPTVTASGKINGAVSSSTNVTVDGLTATPKIGDKFEIIDGDNSIYPQIVVAVGEAYVTSSVAISADNNKGIQFRNQMNFSWPIDNFAQTLKEGMILVPGTNVTADSSIAKYQDTIAEFPGTKQEKIIIKKEVQPISTLTIKPIITKGEVTTQAGGVVFDKQQVLAFGGITLEVGGYGESEILRLYGYDVVFSDLAIALTPITTTTTAAVNNSTSVPVTSRNGILDDISTVSGIGIDPTLVNPTVDTGAGAVTGDGTLVLTTAQTLEDGATLTFAGAGQTATITGNIQVVKAGSDSQTLRFDVDKLLSIT